jgi:hypothetical protein
MMFYKTCGELCNYDIDVKVIISSEIEEIEGKIN